MLCRGSVAAYFPVQVTLAMLKNVVRYPGEGLRYERVTTVQNDLRIER